MIGHYSKVIKRSPIPSLGAVNEACSVLSLQTVIILWCVMGKSGALMAVVSLVVFNHPDASVYLIFLPFIPIPASWPGKMTLLSLVSFPDLPPIWV